MKGFVPTPSPLVDDMVGRLFAETPPRAQALVLDPGCGEGVFIDGVLRWCRRHGVAVPRIVGVEMHPGRAAEARSRFADVPEVEIREADFLLGDGEPADFVIGNPPYVPITGLTTAEKARYRERFAVASGRFDLYGLFFEQALRCLAPDGRLVFVTPEKYLSTDSAQPLRSLLSACAVREIGLLPEDVFPGVVTYPAVTVVDGGAPRSATRVTRRDGAVRTVSFSADGAPVHAHLSDAGAGTHSGLVLEDVVRRISCGVATGADRVFVRPHTSLPAELVPFARPTLAGRQLTPGDDLEPSDVMLLPYDEAGALIAEGDLGALGDALREPETKAALLRRTCVRRKPWYAFHETPPMDDLVRPKLLCKDIAQRPHFWIDRAGTVVPRHSVYYIVPHDTAHLDVLADVLNDDATAEWLMAHAQPAANGYRRLQSSVLKRIPLPPMVSERLGAPPAPHGPHQHVLSLA